MPNIEQVIQQTNQREAKKWQLAVLHAQMTATLAAPLIAAVFQRKKDEQEIFPESEASTNIEIDINEPMGLAHNVATKIMQTHGLQ